MSNMFEVIGSLFSKPQPKRGGVCPLQAVYEISRMQTLPGAQLKVSKKTFLIQTENGWPLFDFQWELISQLRYDTRAKVDFNYTLFDWNGHDLLPTHENMIPVGSVEFVHRYLMQAYAMLPHPLYIPKELDPFTGRVIHYGVDVNFIDGLVKGRHVFVKSATKVKGYTGIISDVRELTEDGVDDGLFHASEVIDILSEWRVFVHRGKILDCRCYSGDTLCYPTRRKVESMVENYKSSPIAYTLDVAVANSIDTVVIECHNFYSCGLYGFNSPKYPYMLSQAFHELSRNNK